MGAELAAANVAAALAFPHAGVQLTAPVSIAAVPNPTDGAPTYAYAGFRTPRCTSRAACSRSPPDPS